MISELTLPEGWIIDERGEHALLVHSLKNCWGTFRLIDGKARQGRFHCGSIAGAEAKARKEFAEREASWQTR